MLDVSCKSLFPCMLLICIKQCKKIVIYDCIITITRCLLMHLTITIRKRTKKRRRMKKICRVDRPCQPNYMTDNGGCKVDDHMFCNNNNGLNNLLLYWNCVFLYLKILTNRYITLIHACA